MTNRLEKLKAEIRALPDIDKVRLVDAILTGHEPETNQAMQQGQGAGL